MLNFCVKSLKSNLEAIMYHSQLSTFNTSWAAYQIIGV